MLKPKLLLHIGDHKTGTTAIQNFCRAHYKTLFKKGIFYPYPIKYPRNFDPENPHIPLLIKRHYYNQRKIFTSIHEIKNGSGFSISEIENILRNWQEICITYNKKLFLSCEAINRLKLSINDEEESRVDYYQLIDNLFKNYFDIQVIFIVRNHVSLANSLYLEGVHSGSIKGDETVEDLIKKRSWKFNYINRIKEINSVFQNLLVNSYESMLLDKDIIPSFLKLLSINDFHEFDKINDRSNNIIRKSLSARDCILKLVLNNIKKGNLTRKENTIIYDWLYSDFVQNVLQKYVNSENNSLWKHGASSKIDFYKSCENQFEFLRNKFDIDLSNMYDFKKDNDSFIGFASNELLTALLKDKKLLNKKYHSIRNSLKRKLEAK